MLLPAIPAFQADADAVVVVGSVVADVDAAVAVVVVQAVVPVAAVPTAELSPRRSPWLELRLTKIFRLFLGIVPVMSV